MVSRKKRKTLKCARLPVHYEMWDWQSQEFDLQKDLLPVPSTSLWAEANHNEVDSWSLFDEQTPIKECTDIDLPFCDIGDIIIKDFDEGKETLQAKRRRMLQFCPDNAEMDCSLTDGLLENLQVDLDFSSDEHLLQCDGTQELPEQWLVDCSQDSENRSPPEEVKSPSAAVEVNISVLQNSLVELEEQPIMKVEKKPQQAKPTPLKAGRSVIRAKKLKVASVAYPFELIKPCGFHGATTLRDINQKILAPPSYRIKHKIDEASAPYQEASAISGKPVVHKTKIHTEGGKGSITITRTRG
ncbi:protein XRI1 isoform X1 [Triticum aestivum]|uniref:protein XRI1 isoform X1 n=1 Tax=Triticum aestivum TaxID=4565 RepID=UPI001D003AB8|nr:protein XRI1-like isoform X1 [Triticum aestivum]